MFNTLWCCNLLYPGNDDKKDTLQWLSHSTKTPEDCFRRLQMTELVQWSVFQVMPKRQTKFRSVFQSERKRETKFKSVFQSNAKPKNENWYWCPFFKVMRKRKTKYEVQNRFSKLGENEKQTAKFKSVFQCHAKTKNGYGTWIPFSHAIEKRLALRYTYSSLLFKSWIRR